MWAEQKKCPVCGMVFETGNLVIGPENPPIKHEFCALHRKMLRDGFVFLVEVENETDADTLGIHAALRTGRVMAIRRDIAKDLVPRMTGDVAFADRNLFGHLDNIMCDYSICDNNQQEELLQ